jgi:hypothetical protein
VFTRDADARVAHQPAAATIVQPGPLHVDAPARRRVAHGVGHQVGQGTVKLAFIAGKLRIVTAFEMQLMAAGRQRCGVGLHAPHHLADTPPVVRGRARAAFQLRQCQQIGHQGLHALRLGRHQHQHALALCFA